MTPTVSFYFSIAVLCVVLSCLTVPPHHVCRCRPGDQCWPSAMDWMTLNNSVDGNLIAVRPIAHVCHHPTFDENACGNLTRLARNSGWRAGQPGALQDWLWEVGSTETETCNTQGRPDEPCHQGRVSVYSVTARSALHVQRAVAFAKHHDLRLVIRNTGHDGSGRSSAPDSLQIFTHYLDAIQYDEDFRPVDSPRAIGPAVSVGAGVRLGDMYTRASREGYTIVGGLCPTVGIAGGFVQGGGVSAIFSHTRGLAVDNTLEFEVVTADAKQIIVNEHRHQDLFWALRGGGGGTFAVVTRLTVRKYPDGPAVFPQVTASSRALNGLLPSHVMVTLLRALRSYNEAGVAGEVLVHSHPTTAVLKLYVLDTTDAVEINGRLDPLIMDLQAEDVVVDRSWQVYENVSSAPRMSSDIYPPEYGIIQGSVLLSEDFFKSPAWDHRLADSLASIYLQPDDMIFINTLGGQVNAHGPLVDTSVHPSWRNSAQLVNILRHVEPTLESRTFVTQILTRVQMPILYSLDPSDPVSYLNMGDPYEPRAPTVYWGQNYRRLSKIKRKWDESSLFITRLGVGSEMWDEDGMCRREFGLMHRLYRFFLSG
ncbi:unnamed protein product [Penicillium olsonii]|nr:unnamed protein product [Penicillium olsonii]CAG7930311.1 unnamed protein product [Penicillium olsonii]